MHPYSADGFNLDLLLALRDELEVEVLAAFSQKKLIEEKLRHLLIRLRRAEARKMSVHVESLTIQKEVTEGTLLMYNEYIELKIVKVEDVDALIGELSE